MLYRYIFLISLIVFSIGCASLDQEKVQPEKYDPHSNANFNEILITHMNINFEVDFNAKQLIGKIKYSVDNFSGTDKLVLDTRDLEIEDVFLGNQNERTSFSKSSTDPIKGEALTIEIKPTTKFVTIHYKTSPDAGALQWLEPELTSDGTAPFLYSDSQPIMARTWFPSMDSPGIRQTYNATVKTSPGLKAIMSGKNAKEKSEDGIYKVVMEQPIPSYLTAIAVGDFQYKSLGPRTGVYAESSIIESAAWEFAETEKFMEAAEALYGPYRWDDYNLVVMPKSYPMGGMENPRINFVTPTIISGDRSLLALVAHELAHSWSGNLVTNANWNDLWINEGFTSYFEQRLMEAVYGRDYQQMLADLDQEKFRHVVGKLKGKEHLTKLHLNLDGIDPEENSGLVAYEKGTFFLTLIEETVGREKFDVFLKKYFDEFAFKTINSQTFVEYLRANLINGNDELEKKLQIDEWVFGSGIPNNMIKVDSPEFTRVDEQLKNWLNGSSAKSLKTDGWTTHHWLHFIRSMPWNLSMEQMGDLDNAFSLTQTGNSEILHSWLLRAIHNEYKPSYDRLENFLMTVGRRKFLRPLYIKLSETPDGMALAKQIYSTARNNYHFSSRQAIDEILGWDQLAVKN